MTDISNILLADKQNPQGYAAFKNAAVRLRDAMVRKGKQPRGSSRLIIEGLRWEANFSMGDDASDYALDDQLGQLWSRRLGQEDERFSDFFRFRESRFDAVVGRPNHPGIA